MVTHSRLRISTVSKKAVLGTLVGFEYDSLAVPSSENIIELDGSKIKLVDTIYYDSNQRAFVLENGTSLHSLSGLSGSGHSN